MMRRSLSLAAVLILMSSVASPAWADHADPNVRQAQTRDPGGTQLLTAGEGEWEFIRNFPANPGSDLEFFRKNGRLFASTGTLGQADEQHVGQRIIRLINKRGQVKPRWRADHASASCTTANPAGTLGLQHDAQVLPHKNPTLLIDTTDATGRCHDGPGGGLEFIDITGIGNKGFEPREIHLTRHAGSSHTVTVDATRPWIVYNNASQSTGMPWIDVLDMRSCMKAGSLEEKRDACRPKVFRIALRPEWAQRINGAGERIEGTESSCHDITSIGTRLYCANLNSSIVLDVAGLTDAKGNIRGTPLKCEIVDGTRTAAKVTNCSDLEGAGSGLATGWKYYGHVNHAGRNGTHNSNTEYTSREQVAVSHQAEPTPDKKWMFVTDERGGGVVPGGASCTELENPYGNGGVHVYDISKPGEFKYAKTPDDANAVFIGDVLVPSSTFCTAHVMAQVRKEQRFVIAWYTQGTKIVDYFIDANGRWTFRETASVVPQGPAANTWASNIFKIERNDDGTVTYYFLATDITRGIDVFKWTGPANPTGTPPPAEGQKEQRGFVGTAGAAGFMLITPVMLLRRRRMSRPHP
jgi:hypothetical protein